MYRPLVGVLLVNSDGKEWTRKILEQLVTLEGVEVYLLDNGCVVAERFSRKELQLYELPLVYERVADRLSEPAALGLLAAKAQEAEVSYMWCLAGLPENGRVLEKMLLVMEQHPSVGLVGGALYGSQGQWRGSWWLPWCLHGFTWRLWGSQLVVSSGHCLVRSRAFEAASGFEERYFLGGFMVDLAYRLRRQEYGSELVEVSSVEVEGKVTVLGEIMTESSLESYFSTRNPFLWARLHLLWWQGVLAGILHTTIVLTRLVKMAITNKGELKTLLMGVRDGWGLLLR